MTEERLGIFQFNPDEDSGGVFMKAGSLFGGVSIFFSGNKLNKYLYKKGEGIRIIFRDQRNQKWKILVETQQK